MNLPYSDNLNIDFLGRLFDNTSECYKFFWFKAIVSKVSRGQYKITYEELVDKMIADAWYMVTEYHLNLGPADSLEKLVNYIHENYPNLRSSEKEEVIIDFLKNTKDKQISKIKNTLTYHVPYRLQAPFILNIRGKDWNVDKKALAEKINKENRLIYYFGLINGLKTTIVIQDEWADYIKHNKEIIEGWLEYNMIIYLQKRNPSVPGIADKLSPPQARNLDKIKKFWKLILTIVPIHEIYNEQLLDAKDISIDHFVPWSYVAHDEMWNLNPTTRSINSSKSNNLPDWNMYFERLAKLQYEAYELIWKYDMVHKEFDKVAKEYINSEDVRRRVYRPNLCCEEFTAELETTIAPVYQSAKSCGFKDWIYVT